MSISKLRIKILLDKKANRVLFAEAGKDFVDFLFSLLSLPVCSVIRLLARRKMVGCIANIYESVKSLDESYILQPQIKNDLFFIPKPASTPGKCPRCSTLMSVPENQLAKSRNNKEGYVKGVVSYVVMDDLTVMPMSSISGVTLLNKLNAKDVGLLEERVVDLGVDQCLELLEISLQSKTPLSEVCLRSNVESVTAVDENMDALMTSFWPKSESPEPKDKADLGSVQKEINIDALMTAVLPKRESPEAKDKSHLVSFQEERGKCTKNKKKSKMKIKNKASGTTLTNKWMPLASMLSKKNKSKSSSRKFK